MTYAATRPTDVRAVDLDLVRSWVVDSLLRRDSGTTFCIASHDELLLAMVIAEREGNPID